MQGKGRPSWGPETTQPGSERSQCLQGHQDSSKSSQASTTAQAEPAPPTPVCPVISVTGQARPQHLGRAWGGARVRGHRSCGKRGRCQGLAGHQQTQPLSAGLPRWWRKQAPRPAGCEPGTMENPGSRPSGSSSAGQRGRSPVQRAREARSGQRPPQLTAQRALCQAGRSGSAPGSPRL